jgi:N-acetyl-alpha-D-muramate 1-phosphate uridylyltransferase
MRTVVVLAGGLGTRVAHLTGADRPKALLPIAGRPFIDVKLAQLATSGAQRAIVLTGHGRDELEDHVSALAIAGLDISLHDDGPRLRGTGGAIAAIGERLPDPFWVTYGDTLVEAPLAEIEHDFADDRLGVMTVLHNRDRWARSNVAVEGRLVTRYEKGSPLGTFEWIDYGLLLLRPAILEPFRSRPAFDLTEPIQHSVECGRMDAFVVTERFHDIGDEDAWRATDEWARRTAVLERLGLA